MSLETSLWRWSIFGAVVLILLVFDLGVLNRKNAAISLKRSLWLSAGYIGVALAFAAWVSWQLGADSAMDFLTGYAIEKTLALDNIFLISTVFTLLAVPREYQHRVLFWGILGVLILRAILIGLGAALVASFHWVLYGFGAVLVLTGIGMFVRREGSNQIPQTALRWLQRRLPVIDELHGRHFFVRVAAPGAGGDAPKRWFATPLLLALVLIELLDLLFAVDSVPAVFAITQDPFIVYTSNIFAVLGLRALYFSLADLTERFHYLRYALAAVLVFVGAKILATDVIGTMPAWVSLSITVGLLATGVLYSLHRTRANAVLTVG
ncbi:MAG: TerC/Alx family metal homeostasis membrane protein [Proteobacteria bacterium]|nr:TerC/Alx family metal homeostasis membrane protein [Pseudomonadota bacterium]